MIVFVGDEPSAKNIDPAIAFWGTQSYVTLMGWIGHMQIFYNNFELTNKDSLEYIVDHEEYKDCIYISLGAKASKSLQKFEIEHFALPHPSGKNRKLNDKRFVSQCLMECREWIDEQKL